MRFSIGFIIAFTFMLAAHGMEQSPIAVLDLKAPGLNLQEAETLSDKLRYELFNTGKFTVVERSQMNTILKEQGFQQTGCTSSECVVEVGQLLGVKLMVAGSVGRVGDVFLITTRLIDVETGEVQKNEAVEIQGTITDVMSVGIRNAVRKLCGLAPDRAVKRGGYKSPLAAGCLGFLPAGGHIYMGQTGRGLLFEMGYWTLQIFGIISTVSSDDNSNMGLGLGLMMGANVVKIWEIIDAVKLANDHNKKLYRRTSGLNLVPQMHLSLNNSAVSFSISCQMKRPD